MAERRIIVVALGGNAVLNQGEEATAASEIANVERACAALLPLIQNYDVIITHGNGPQVGNILSRMEECEPEIPAMPLDVCVAQSQGELGYFIQGTLGSILRQKGLRRPVCTILTQAIVDANDPAFQKPTKPIGPFLSRAKARRKVTARGWSITEDSGRGYRRAVPSPRPLRIVEEQTILKLAKMGTVVIAAGGGGIPVVELADGRLQGVEAVVDKDLAAGILARDVGASLFIILTSVEQVALDYNTPRQSNLRHLTVAEAQENLRKGQFPPGSMGPKIQAALDYLERGQGEVIITDAGHLDKALQGKTGTRITARKSISKAA